MRTPFRRLAAIAIAPFLFGLIATANPAGASPGRSPEFDAWCRTFEVIWYAPNGAAATPQQTPEAPGKESDDPGRTIESVPWYCRGPGYCPPEFNQCWIYPGGGGGGGGGQIFQSDLTVVLNTTLSSSTTAPVRGISDMEVEVRWEGEDEILESDDDVLTTRVTDETGAARFGRVPRGTYGLRIVTSLPAGLTVENESARTFVVTQPVKRHRVRLVGPGSFKGHVYYDLNGNVNFDNDQTAQYYDPQPFAGGTLQWAGVNNAFGDNDDLAIPTSTSGSEDGWTDNNRLPLGQYRIAVDVNSIAPLKTNFYPTYNAHELFFVLSSSVPAVENLDLGYRDTCLFKVTTVHKFAGIPGQRIAVGGIPITIRYAGARLGEAGTFEYTAAIDRNGQFTTELPVGDWGVLLDEESLPNGLEAPVPNVIQIVPPLPPPPGGNPTPITEEIQLKGLLHTSPSVFLDSNGNGSYDTGETSLAGTRVRITWFGFDNNESTVADNRTVETTMTSALYQTVGFLPGGRFRLSVLTGTLPIQGLAPTTDPDGGLENTAVIDISTGFPAGFSLFGYVRQHR